MRRRIRRFGWMLMRAMDSDPTHGAVQELLLVDIRTATSITY